MSKTKKKTIPPMTEEARENRLINLAIDVAEKQLMEGTASSQIITHYLKLGSRKEKLELEKLEEEKNLLKTKRENLESSKYAEEAYREALEAMKIYSGRS